MIELDKVVKLNNIINQYFEENQSINEVKAKDLVLSCIKGGLFNKDNRNGKPIRDILRSLDKEDQLDLIPSLKFERKETNTYWTFCRIV